MHGPIRPIWNAQEKMTRAFEFFYQLSDDCKYSNEHAYKKYILFYLSNLFGRCKAQRSDHNICHMLFENLSELEVT